ncbi:unnamed protein product [Ceutorhynchus assimilis]|uniref:Uncharacterized protein n=1 Tax=Ceutorhynchus assimilis TaxID=467358 RepID=A0A9N9MP23_9CUCU|nr:unnamed protein product [Ceutorhynchus assimilis]
MLKFKTILVLLAIIAICAADRGIKRYKKKKHHLRHHHFLYYLTFLAVKLKIVFILGTIFTVSLVAAKIVAILKISEYMKHKYHHEEKIIYSNPYESHDHHDWGGSHGGYSFPSDISSNNYESFPPDISVDHPPEDAYNYDRSGPHQSARDVQGSISTGIYDQIMRIGDHLRQLNLTDIALNDMGIKDENCKKKFVCKADYNAHRNIILQTGFSILRDASYQKYKPNATATSEEACDELYQECTENVD